MRKIILFIDSGDTLVDETTEIRDRFGIVKEARFVKDALDTLEQLKEDGYRICMVADGQVQSFKNVYRKMNAQGYFENMVISERVGVQKPDVKMFEEAMHLMQIQASEKYRVVMVGNNLRRDIAGANRYGITSVWIRWSKRYFTEFEEEDWKPDYSIDCIKELPELLERIEKSL